jgi:hypothetical protein
MSDMNFPWDVFGVGAALGGTTGLVAGYQLRKLVVRVQQWRANRYRKLAKEYDAKKREAVETGRPVVTSRQDPEYIPIKRTRRVSPNPPVVDRPDWSANPWRDEVIAALTGAGYKKADAIKAVDACSLAERASGPEHWTVAALRHAHGAK